MQSAVLLSLLLILLLQVYALLLFGYDLEQALSAGAF